MTKPTQPVSRVRRHRRKVILFGGADVCPIPASLRNVEDLRSSADRLAMRRCGIGGTVSARCSPANFPPAPVSSTCASSPLEMASFDESPRPNHCEMPTSLAWSWIMRVECGVLPSPRNGNRARRLKFIRKP